MGTGVPVARKGRDPARGGGERAGVAAGGRVVGGPRASTAGRVGFVIGRTRTLVRVRPCLFLEALGRITARPWL